MRAAALSDADQQRRAAQVDFDTAMARFAAHEAERSVALDERLSAVEVEEANRLSMANTSASALVAAATADAERRTAAAREEADFIQAAAEALRERTVAETAQLRRQAAA
ncbi:MAG TPA: hypothetical protein DEH05_04835, partial [Propionibacteriaceae bacterium]|nr:hypothetical protein [Propionibacteriaceae bacterium]